MRSQASTSFMPKVCNLPDAAIWRVAAAESLAAEGCSTPSTNSLSPVAAQNRHCHLVSAAALRDILTVLQRRKPFVAVLIAPTLVQGELALAQIARAAMAGRP